MGTEEMKQGNEDWLSWRADGIGASEIAAVMGKSPYSNALKVWREKRLWIEERKLVEHKPNFAMERGTRNEPKVRADIELRSQKEWPPDLIQDPLKPYLRASLDGRSGDEILEIKVPSKKQVDDVEERGILAVPEHYMMQMQYQLRISGASRCLFVCYNPDENKIAECWVPRNEEMIKELEKKADEFWASVLEGIEPGTRDVDDNFLALAKDYRELSSTIKLLEEKLERAKSGLLEYVRDKPSLHAGGLRITPYTVKGSIEYAKIPALQGLDLEPYRKPDRAQHRITID